MRAERHQYFTASNQIVFAEVACGSGLSPTEAIILFKNAQGDVHSDHRDGFFFCSRSCANIEAALGSIKKNNLPSDISMVSKRYQNIEKCSYSSSQQRSMLEIFRSAQQGEKFTAKITRKPHSM